MSNEMIIDEVVRLYNEHKSLDVVMFQLSKIIPQNDYERVLKGLERLRNE